MCGITGILTLNPNASVSRECIQKMTDAVRHRGPDDEGIYLNGCVALGHRRLAIIDLSPDGHQPMTGPDNSTWLVYNGEIYNYLDIKRELQARGHQFKSHSDTEVILHAYQEYGPACLSHFNGMFAFALWDERQRQLFLARDRFGIKPLYYCHVLRFGNKSDSGSAGRSPPPQSAPDLRFFDRRRARPYQRDLLCRHLQTAAGALHAN
jgi:asparagine synthase (glutamine-hydrolysing)